MSGATVAPAALRRLAEGWERLYPSAVCSGICGDRAHQQRGGFHIGRRFQSKSNYSVIRPDDRPGNGPDDAAAAVDMSMNRRDMVLCNKRIKAVFDNPGDPRRKYINAVNAWSGSGDAVRYDMVARTRSRATPDHKSHVHGETRRRWVNSQTMVAAWLSMLAGDSVAVYLRQVGVPAAKPAAGKPGGKAVPAKLPAVPKYPGRVLRRTTRTAPDLAVKTVQTRLRERGYRSLGTPDGLFGPKLEAAVKAFQRQCRVPADGVIGPKTWPLFWTRPLGS